VKSFTLLVATSMTLGPPWESVAAQSMPMIMPGMKMSAHPKAKPAKSKVKPAQRELATTKANAIPKHGSNGAPMTMDHGSMEMPAPSQAYAAPKPPGDHSQIDYGAIRMPMKPRGASPATTGHAAMVPMHMDQPTHSRDGMEMRGALGPYPMQREASGTAWRPDNSEPMGLMKTGGGWTLMTHGVLNLVVDHQSGRRGDDKTFASGMLMAMAKRPLGNGALQFKAMVSPDPLMGASGYPLLLASGETANGRDRLIDRQHPHDFLMELSASVSRNIGRNSAAFLYAGLPGEPAFGPPAFMHREAIEDAPEAPISHHWLDSTHISFGVATAGLVLDRFKIEVSRFNGREPDQRRWNIETGPLDSTAVRLSWNPTSRLALQGSWGHFVNPEQLEPGVDQKRLSASALYAREIAPGWKFAGTLAWGRKTVEHHNDDAYVVEASLKHDAWTVFGRGEMTENRELVGVEHAPAYCVGKVLLGVVRDFPIADHLSIGAGGLFALNFVPNGLAGLYGGSNPTGLMAFARIKLN
jgi:hypothetical protein